MNMFPMLPTTRLLLMTELCGKGPSSTRVVILSTSGMAVDHLCLYLARSRSMCRGQEVVSEADKGRH